MRNYDVWIQAHKLVLFVYRAIPICFPPGAQHDPWSQTKRDFAHFLDNSFRSLQELECASLLAQDREYISREKYQRRGLIIDEVKTKFINLIKASRKQ